MRWRKAGVLVCCLALLVSSIGCVGATGMRQAAYYVTRTKAAVIPPVGLLWTRSSAPVTAQVGGPPMGTKMGRASVNSIAIPPNPVGIPAVGLISWGDMSQKQAARNGGITEITHVDYRMTVFLMIFRRVTLTVYGN